MPAVQRILVLAASGLLTAGCTFNSVVGLPAGHYVYSPFHLAQFDGGVLAFEAPAGKTTYLGDFVYGKNSKVSVANNIEEAKPAIRAQLPELGGDIFQATGTAVKRPSLFLCTP